MGGWLSGLCGSSAADSTGKSNNNKYQQQQNYARNDTRQVSHRGAGGGDAISNHPQAQSAITEAETWRQRAHDHGANMRNAFEASQQAWKRNDKHTAKQKSDEGKQQQDLMKQANQKAADLQFYAHNDALQRPLSEIDLHLLYVEEAVERTLSRIKQCRSKGIKQLVVIVGQGIHSADHVRKIAPAIIKLAQDQHLHLSQDTPHPGCYTISL